MFHLQFLFCAISVSLHLLETMWCLWWSSRLENSDVALRSPTLASFFAETFLSDVNRTTQWREFAVLFLCPATWFPRYVSLAPFHFSSIYRVILTRFWLLRIHRSSRVRSGHLISFALSVPLRALGEFGTSRARLYLFAQPRRRLTSWLFHAWKSR